MTIEVSDPCVVEVRHVLRPVSFESDWPSWQYYRSTSQLPWSQPGGAGAGDSVAVSGAVPVSPGNPLVLDDIALLPIFQSMLDQAAPPFFLIRRIDTGGNMITITTSSLTLEFELTSPPA